MTATLDTTTSIDTTIEAAADTVAAALLMLDPSCLLLEGNVRASVHLDKDFLASVKEQGVLVPIVAVRTGDGSHRVRYGQRRTLAAIEAKHPLVPVYVAGDEASTDSATIERIVAQVHENELRAGLSTADKAAAVEQLSLLGLSAAQIVKKVKGSRVDVNRALAVAGSKLATAAAQRYEFLTLEMAATVSEFEDDKQTVTALVAAAKKGEGHFAHVAQRARDDREHAQACAAVTAQLTDAGVSVVDAPSYSDRSAKQLRELLTDSGKELTPAAHKSCPGHAAYVGRAGHWQDGKVSAVYVCTAWSANGHRDRYGSAAKTPAAQLSETERAKAKAERRAVIENNKAWTSSEKVRRAWLTTFLARKSAPKGAAAFVAVELAHSSHELGKALEYNGNTLLHQLVGVKDKTALAATASTASDARAQVLCLAFVLAAYEAQTDKQTWRQNDPDMGRYFAFLAANGYQLSDVEKLCLPQPARKPASRRRPAASDPAVDTCSAGGTCPAGDTGTARTSAPAVPEAHAQDESEQEEVAA